MTYESVIAELFTRFPDLAEEYRSRFTYLLDEEPLPYVVFGSLLVPALENALKLAETERVASLCAFIEDVSLNSAQDLALENLLCVEIGEWLGCVANEDYLSPFLGEATKRVCLYVPGLATQRIADAAEREAKKHQ